MVGSMSKAVDPSSLRFYRIPPSSLEDIVGRPRFGGNLYLVRTCKASKKLSATFSGNLQRQPRVSRSEGVDKAAGLE